MIVSEIYFISIKFCSMLIQLFLSICFFFKNNLSPRKALFSLLMAALVIGWSSCSEAEVKKAPPLEIPIVEVQQQDVLIETEYTGQTYGAADIKIAPRVYGIVQSLNFKEGTLVKEGDLLYTIDPIPYQNKVDAAAGHLAEANTMMVKAKADLDMIEPLAKINAVSQRELVSTKAQYEASKAKVQSAEAALDNAKIELSYCSITAPITGLIGISKVREGDYVSQGPLANLNTISQLDSIRVRFTISEQEFMRIQKEMRAEYLSAGGLGTKIQLILSDGSIYPHPGRLSFADRQIDPSTGAITIEANYPNPDRLLRPGQYVKVRVVTSVVKNALLIPQRSVIEMQGIYQVYVLSDSNKVQMKIIQPGSFYKDAYLVLDGLNAKDKIAMGGTALLKNGSVVIPKPTPWEAGGDSPKSSPK
ncbi:MAG: efflux RND transporter periplasmic adaptor subunit [Bacteroidia bacterium]|jgi:membrane fusion protein (multidrug efflux system)|nr:efflux RND transporter periplasmic adaptor subunit [Bacteroidia bacterium]